MTVAVAEQTVIGSRHTRRERGGNAVRRTATGKGTCIFAMSLPYLLYCVNRTARISCVLYKFAYYIQIFTVYTGI